MGGQIVLALARHFEADFLQGGDNVGAAPHRAVFDALHQVVADQVARVGLMFEAGSQLRRVDVGAMARLLCSGALRVVRAAPAVLVVEGVAQRIEGSLPARRRDVQAAARLEVALRGEDVRVDAAAALAVQDRGPRVAVRLQSRPRRLLELVEDGFDLLLGRLIVRRPRDHDRRVLALELERIGYGGHYVWIPAQHFDAIAPLPLGVPLADEVVNRRGRQALPVGEELNVHRRRPLRCGPRRAATARTTRGGRAL